MKPLASALLFCSILPLGALALEESRAAPPVTRGIQPCQIQMPRSIHQQFSVAIKQWKTLSQDPAPARPNLGQLIINTTPGEFTSDGLLPYTAGGSGSQLDVFERQNYVPGGPFSYIKLKTLQASLERIWANRGMGLSRPALSLRAVQALTELRRTVNAVLAVQEFDRNELVHNKACRAPDPSDFAYHTRDGGVGRFNPQDPANGGWAISNHPTTPPAAPPPQVILENQEPIAVPEVTEASGETPPPPSATSAVSIPEAAPVPHSLRPPVVDPLYSQACTGMGLRGFQNLVDAFGQEIYRAAPATLARARGRRATDADRTKADMIRNIQDGIPTMTRKLMSFLADGRPNIGAFRDFREFEIDGIRGDLQSYLDLNYSPRVNRAIHALMRSLPTADALDAHINQCRATIASPAGPSSPSSEAAPATTE